MTAEPGGPRQPHRPAPETSGTDPVPPSSVSGDGAEVDRVVFSGSSGKVGSEPAMTTDQSPAKVPEQAGEKTGTPTTAKTAPPPKPKPVVPSTKASTAWITWCVTAVILVGLIVFILQNTERTDVSFLWMDGSAPLGVMLLIAAVGAALITALLGTIRIAQLRKLSQRRANRPR